MIDLHLADVPFDRDPPPGRPHTSQEELNELVWRSTILCEKSQRAGADRPSVCLTQRAAGLQ
jgi:hypothetical protein